MWDDNKGGIDYKEKDDDKGEGHAHKEGEPSSP